MHMNKTVSMLWPKSVYILHACCFKWLECKFYYVKRAYEKHYRRNWSVVRQRNQAKCARKVTTPCPYVAMPKNAAANYRTINIYCLNDGIDFKANLRKTRKSVKNIPGTSHNVYT